MSQAGESLFAETEVSADALPSGPRVSRRSPFYRGFVGGLGVLLAIALGLAVRETASVLILVLVAILLAIGVNPIVELLIRYGLRRRWAVAVVSVLAVGVAAFIGFVLVGVVRDQITSLLDNLPNLIADLRKNKAIAKLDRHYHFLAEAQRQVESHHLLHNAFGDAVSFGLTVLGALVNTVIVFVLTVYFLGALPRIKYHAYSLVPAVRRPRVAALGDEILRRVGRYVVGAVLVALLAGTVTFFLTLGVGLGKYALPLAMFVAVLDLVPLVGSLIGAGSVTLIAFATSLGTGLTVLIVYVVYEALEGYVIYPRVMRSSVDVPEYVTIIAVLIGGALDGVVGALLALPIAAACLLLVREVWVRRNQA